MQTHLMGRDMITPDEWTDDEVNTIFEVAFDLKRRRALGEPHALLRDKVLAMLFFFTSTRTRVSFEAGMAQLGGHAQFIDSTTTQISHGDTAKEIGEIIGRYCDGIAITSSLFVDETTHVEPVRYPEGSNVMFLLGTLLTDGGGPLPRPLRYLFNILRHPLQFLRTLDPRGWARRSVILLVMQTEDNKMAFRLKRRWWMPWRRKLSSTVDGRAIPSYLPAANAAGKALAAKMPGQAKNAITEVLLNTPLTAHIMGGCVIGADRDHGVIDKRCQVFGYENMYIVDGAALPANLGVNPSLTITALAEYAMSHIPEKRS